VHLPRVIGRNRLAVLHKRGGSDITDDKARKENPALKVMPLASAAQLIVLSEMMRKELGRVAAPALVAHGERDRTVPIASSFALATAMASKEVERLWLPRSGHVLPVDVEGAEVCNAVVGFFARHAPPNAARAAEATSA
jgi:esterase/lipase